MWNLRTALRSALNCGGNLVNLVNEWEWNRRWRGEQALTARWRRPGTLDCPHLQFGISSMADSSPSSSAKLIRDDYGVAT